METDEVKIKKDDPCDHFWFDVILKDGLKMRVCEKCRTWYFIEKNHDGYGMARRLTAAPAPVVDFCEDCNQPPINCPGPNECQGKLNDRYKNCQNCGTSNADVDEEPCKDCFDADGRSNFSKWSPPKLLVTQKSKPAAPAQDEAVEYSHDGDGKIYYGGKFIFEVLIRDGDIVAKRLNEINSGRRLAALVVEGSNAVDDCGNCLHKMACKFSPHSPKSETGVKCQHWKCCYDAPAAPAQGKGPA